MEHLDAPPDKLIAATVQNGVRALDRKPEFQAVEGDAALLTPAGRGGPMATPARLPAVPAPDCHAALR